LRDVGDPTLNKTERHELVKARIGQSAFKNKLLRRSSCKCELCGISDPRFLNASHIKPWCEFNSMERLDADNGFLLCPNHDVVFDTGYISFDHDGEILISSSLGETSWSDLNLDVSMKIIAGIPFKQYTFNDIARIGLITDNEVKNNLGSLNTGKSGMKI
jgi:predicted restriction endonuclease